MEYLLTTTIEDLARQKKSTWTSISFMVLLHIYLMIQSYLKIVGSVWDFVKDPGFVRLWKGSIVTNHM